MLIGFVCGLEREAVLLPKSVHVRCCGPGPDRARRAARTLIADGCDALVSFGTAGGLDPTLPSGTLLIPPAVVWSDSGNLPWEIKVDPSLRAHLSTAAGPGDSLAPLLGSDVPILSPEAKADLFARFGATAVDMESHAVAREAQERAVPFAIVRAIADPASRTIPVWALGGVDEKGRTRILPILAALLRAPARTKALARLAGDAKAAENALKASWSGFSPLVFPH